MAVKLLDLRNDFWIRFLVVPFVGLCVPYFLSIIPQDLSRSSFLIEHPSLYTFFISVLLSEANRRVIILSSRFIRTSEVKIARHLIRLVLLLVFNALMLLFPVYFWYKFILGLDQFQPFLWQNIINSLSVILIFLLLYESSFFLYKWGVQISKTKNLEIENTKIKFVATFYYLYGGFI